MPYCFALMLALLIFFGATVFFSNKDIRTTVVPRYRVHYLISGLFLSLFFPKEFTQASTALLGPVLMFCIGWTGLFFGMHLETRNITSKVPSSYKRHFIAPASIFLVILIIGLLHAFIADKSAVRFDTVFLVAAFSALTLYSSHMAGTDRPRMSLDSLTADVPPMRNIPYILMFCLTAGLIYGQGGITLFGRIFEGSATFIAAHFLTALCIGMFASKLIQGAESRSGILAVLIGIGAFVGAFSDSFMLSPLIVGLLSGCFLINSSLRRPDLILMAVRLNTLSEKILYFGAGILLAILTQKYELNFLYIAAGALGLAAIRILIAWLSSRILYAKTSGQGTGAMYFWAGLCGQGALALAAVIEYHLRMQDTPGIVYVLVAALTLSQIAVLASAYRLNTR